MSVLFTCGSCQAKLRAESGLEGKRLKCPKCGRAVTVPASPAAPGPPPAAAVCFQCGEFKPDALAACEQCGAQPVNEDDRAESLRMTAQHLDRSALEALRAEVKRRRAALSEDLIRQGAKAVLNMVCPACRRTWPVGFKESGAPHNITCGKCGWSGVMAVRFEDRPAGPEVPKSGRRHRLTVDRNVEPAVCAALAAALDILTVEGQVQADRERVDALLAGKSDGFLFHSDLEAAEVAQRIRARLGRGGEAAPRGWDVREAPDASPQAGPSAGQPPPAPAGGHPAEPGARSGEPPPGPSLVGTWVGDFDPITFLPSGQFITNKGKMRGRYVLKGSALTLLKADGSVWDTKYSFADGQLRYNYLDARMGTMLLRKQPP